MKLLTYLHSYNGVYFSISASWNVAPMLRHASDATTSVKSSLRSSNTNWAPSVFPIPLEIYLSYLCTCLASLLAQILKNLPTIQEIWVRSLGQDDPLEEGMTPTLVSCLENSMDRRAWRATVHGVTRSQAWLSDLHFRFLIFLKAINSLRKCKSKPQWGTTSHQSECLRSKNLQAINAGEGVEKREPYTVGGNAN